MGVGTLRKVVHSFILPSFCSSAFHLRIIETLAYRMKVLFQSVYLQLRQRLSLFV